ncbi:hypothetical protein HPB52_006289 [Rhipicephalus sanguineus]|uniref:Uncharacterized protein n=1 Tax=Rhipicephalus sanguineus TaxID=34632 RepID=A0A9D4SS46_RHISA|nr:hypothetical protein HPB52_006289 [Rhipicephalus sanguineus]
MNRTLQRIVHDFRGTDGELIQALKDRYICTDAVPPCALEYTGSENAKLDAEITKEEVLAAAQAANRNSAPGSDGITNAMIRNLSNEVLEQIAQFLNDHCWSQAEVTQARILGFWVQSNGKASHTIKTPKTTVKQIARMIRRITYHKKGMKEKDTLRLVQALVMSRVAYGLPYHLLDRSEESQVDALIRSAFKVALGLPMSTPTQRLLDLEESPK